MQFDATVPVILDRVHQARVLNALEPEWEARFEPRSYGFRPGRGCHDAIAAIFQVAKGKSPRRLWVLDADLAGAFDRIAHDHILHMIGSFPAWGMVRAVVEGGRGRATAGCHRTEEGTPQGGVISPLLSEHRPARDGGRPPESATAHGTVRHRGLAGADQIRRRLRRALPHQAGSARGQGTLGRRGWRREAWRSTRTRRTSCPSRRASTSWDSTSADTATSR